jgi:nitrous oxide reductase accessory protein NosL
MLLHTLPKKYTPDNLPAIQVKDYYNQQFTNARTAYYVTESDITGPMGADFIPFSDRKAAEEFMKDHAGREIWTFQRITVNIVKKAVQTHE